MLISPAVAAATSQTPVREQLEELQYLFQVEGKTEGRA